MTGRVRARELGVELGGMKPGRFNAITDVEGVGVGHTTLIEEDDVRTGVTAIVPHRENPYEVKVTAGVDLFNAYGKATGLPQVINEGNIETPIMLTETLNTWKVADATLDYMEAGYGVRPRSLNVVVGETNGGGLTDNFGRHVDRQHVFEAIDVARGMKGTVPEGCVGGGTPMTGFGFKGGIGTASRVHEDFTVGVLVQLNCGRKDDFRIGGVPVGREVVLPERPTKSPGNSIMMIVATDMDLNSRQLWKVAKRCVVGLSRTGSHTGNSSGDFSIAFSTGARRCDVALGDRVLNPVYRATVEATEEAIVNALFKAETMRGRNGRTRYALPYERLPEIFEKYGRPLKKV
jgi:D-aminopeptidase